MSRMFPIITRFQHGDGPTASMLARPKSRANKELRYLMKRGLVVSCGTRRVRGEKTYLYRVSEKGCEAHDIYETLTRTTPNLNSPSP